MAHIVGTSLKFQVQIGKKPDDCWIWQGQVTEDGYGMKSVGGKCISAKRWMWMVLFGSIPPSMVISSKCGNRLCVNPHHLVMQTQADANRGGVGTMLMPEDVYEIKRAKKNHGPSVAAHLAEKFNVSKRAVWDIWGLRSWGRPGRRKKKGSLIEPVLSIPEAA